MSDKIACRQCDRKVRFYDNSYGCPETPMDKLPSNHFTKYISIEDLDIKPEGCPKEGDNQ